MKTYYIIQMLSGEYVSEYGDWYGYSLDVQKAASFDSEFDAITNAPDYQPFTIIKFYAKWKSRTYF